jgi:hypothetical protein
MITKRIRRVGSSEAMIRRAEAAPPPALWC